MYPAGLHQEFLCVASIPLQSDIILWLGALKSCKKVKNDLEDIVNLYVKCFLYWSVWHSKM